MTIKETRPPAAATTTTTKRDVVDLNQKVNCNRAHALLAHTPPLCNPSPAFAAAFVVVVVVVVAAVARVVFVICVHTSVSVSALWPCDTRFKIES